MACQVSRWAEEVLAVGGVFTAQGRKALVELDRTLRDEHHTLNPGTTADLTAAAIFLVLLYDLRSGPAGGNVQSVGCNPVLDLQASLPLISTSLIARSSICWRFSSFSCQACGMASMPR